MVLEVLLDDTYAFHFIEEDDDLPMFSMAALIARRSLNRCHGYFEQTVPLYSIDESQSHFRMKRTTFEILVREVVGMGFLPVGNPFRRQAIDAWKQVSIFLWCIANQETTWLIADRFNVTYNSVSRVVRRMLESVLVLRNQYIKWPNGKIACSLISVIEKTFRLCKMILISSQKAIQLIFFCNPRPGTQLREAMESFRAEGGFPGVVGVIDGSLVKIRAPVGNPESYICRKKYHALQLQVV